MNAWHFRWAVDVTGGMRRVSFFGTAALGLLWVVGKVSALGALPPPPKIPDFEFHAPLPVIAVEAARAGISLDGIAAPEAEASELKPGDRITALVSLAKGGGLTQWVVEMSGVEMNAQEKTLPPLRTWTFFTNTGTEIFLGGTRAALRVRVLGPYVRSTREREVSKNAREQHGRVLVNADFLKLGLDRGCESVLSVNAAKLKDPALKSFAWSVRAKPFSDEEIATGRALAAPLGITPERERTLAGANPALGEFFNVISQTPGLQDILKSVIDVPWWEIVKRGGDARVAIMPLFRQTEEVATEAFSVGSLGQKTYALPFFLSIAGKPALVGKLAVTSARPPLLTSAGIVGVVACAPEGDGPRVMLQVISARSGDVEPSAK